MSSFHMHEGMFELAEGWTDQSMHVLSRALPSGKLASLVINREPLDGPTFDAHVESVLKKLRSQLPRFTTRSRADVEVGERTVHLVSCSFRQGGAEYAQVLAFLQLEVDFPAPTARVVTFTMTAPSASEAPARAELMSILESLRLRRV